MYFAPEARLSQERFYQRKPIFEISWYFYQEIII
jgi:hypothetical protein